MRKSEEVVTDSVIPILEKTASVDNISKNNLDAITGNILSKINENGTIWKFRIVQIESSCQNNNLVEPFCWRQQNCLNMDEMSSNHFEEFLGMVRIGSAMQGSLRYGPQYDN